MKKFRLLFSLASFFGAIAILLVSLSSVSAVHSTNGVSDKQFYFSGDILPDHVAYPILMAVDRARLEAATPVDQIYLETEYANRRLGYAEELADKDKKKLALSTFTKSQKYLLQAGNKVIDNDMSPALAKHVQATLEYHLQKSEDFSKSFDDDKDRAVIDGLREQVEVMIEQLSSRTQE